MDRLTYSALSDCGRVRPRNEDNWFADGKPGLFIVSDGMGGATAGAVASQVVVEALPVLVREQMSGLSELSTPEARQRLSNVLQDLSLHVRITTWGQAGLQGMGATVVAALIRGRQALIAHLGDSRAYLLRHQKLQLLTRDHSVVQFLLDAGKIRPEDASTHPARGQITRFVGMMGDPLPDVSFLELCPGDRLLLCTDGLTGLVPHEQLLSILQSDNAEEDICSHLVKAANDAGGYDNITALVISVPSYSGS